jgi:hypothetical protein
MKVTFYCVRCNLSFSIETEVSKDELPILGICFPCAKVLREEEKEEPKPVINHHRRLP